MTNGFSKKVTNKASLKPRIGKKCIGSNQCDNLQLFNKLVLVGGRENSIGICLGHKLTYYLLSLFHEEGQMRPRDKSEIAMIFKLILEKGPKMPVLTVAAAIIDRKWILWQVCKGLGYYINS